MTQKMRQNEENENGNDRTNLTQRLHRLAAETIAIRRRSQQAKLSRAEMVSLVGRLREIAVETKIVTGRLGTMRAETERRNVSVMVRRKAEDIKIGFDKLQQWRNIGHTNEEVSLDS